MLGVFKPDSPTTRWLSGPRQIDVDVAHNGSVQFPFAFSGDCSMSWPPSQSKRRGAKAATLPVGAPADVATVPCELRRTHNTVVAQSMVILNVYDLSTSDLIKDINRAVLPLISGGLYHVGLEVWDTEYSYGFTTSGPGIYRLRPRNDPDHTFRESVPLGLTKLSQHQVNRTVRELTTEWIGSDYHWATRNCCHFCARFADTLGVNPMPSWVDHLSRSASAIAAPLSGAYRSIEAMTVACNRPLHASNCASPDCGAPITINTTVPFETGRRTPEPLATSGSETINSSVIEGREGDSDTSPIKPAGILEGRNLSKAGVFRMQESSTASVPRRYESSEGRNPRRQESAEALESSRILEGRNL